MRDRNPVILIFALSIFFSCSPRVHNTVFQDYKTADAEFSDTVKIENRNSGSSYIGRKNQLKRSADTSYCVGKTIEFQDSCDDTYDHVLISSIDKDSLQFIFVGESDSVAQKYKYKYKNGFYHIVLDKKTLGVPFIYFFHFKRHLYLGLNDSELIMDYHSVRYGNIFIISAGDSRNYQVYFEKLQ